MADREHEPGDAWQVLDGARVVATLDSPRWCELFWATWRLCPVTGGGQGVLDTERWARCDFVFRDIATGHICETFGSPSTLRCQADGSFLIDVRSLVCPPAHPPHQRLGALQRVMRALMGASS